MGDTMSALISDPQDLLSLEPEELAGTVIEHLNSVCETDQRNLNREIFCSDLGIRGYPREHAEGVSEALMEAWIWLEREGLIAPKPGATSVGYYFITRRGKRMKNAADIEAYNRANLLPKNLVHPIIVQKVWSAFLRGDYDTAVFQAFREVEIAVRNAGDFAPEDIGVPLMRKAFDKSKGPLVFPDFPDAEREAMCHLFAGAIGLYKNPRSHRQVPRI